MSRGDPFLPAAQVRKPLGYGALFLLRPSQRACKKQTAAPASLRLLLPQAAPQLRSPLVSPVHAGRMGRFDGTAFRCFLNAPETFCEKPCQFAAGPLYW